MQTHFSLPSALAVYAFRKGKRHTSLLAVFGAAKSICKGNRFRDCPDNHKAIGAVCGLSRNSVKFYIDALVADNWLYRKRGLIYIRSTRTIARGLSLGGRMCFLIPVEELKHSRIANAILRHVGESISRNQKHYKQRIPKNPAYLDTLVSRSPSNALVQRKRAAQSEDRWISAISSSQSTKSDLVPIPWQGPAQESPSALFVGSYSEYFAMSYSLIGGILGRTKSTMFRRMKQCQDQGLAVKQNVFRQELEFNGSISLLELSQKNPTTYHRYRVVKRVNGTNVLCEVMANRWGFRNVQIVKPFEK